MQFKALAEYFRPITIDTTAYLNQSITNGSKKILIEGAQAAMLDIDFGIVSLFLCAPTNVVMNFAEALSVFLSLLDNDQS